jgi:hypothetical protein
MAITPSRGHKPWHIRPAVWPKVAARLNVIETSGDGMTAKRLIVQTGPSRLT